jgi:hypothetical protein
MRELATIRERYMRDELPIRLGGLAANLTRIRAFSEHSSNCNIVENLLNESKFFIEWTAPDANLELQVELIELQLQLARWQRSWLQIWNDDARRTSIAEKAQNWSERILKISGLV